MAKPEWGAKHVCEGCGAKYYDMQQSPVTCPKCGEKASSANSRSRRGRNASKTEVEETAAAAAKPEIAAVEDDDLLAEDDDSGDDADDDALLDDDEEDDFAAEDIVRPGMDKDDKDS